MVCDKENTVMKQTNKTRKNISRILRSTGMRYADLGKAMGVTAPAAHFWMSGKNNPVTQRLPRLAKVTGVSLAVLEEAHLRDRGRDGKLDRATPTRVATQPTAEADFSEAIALGQLLAGIPTSHWKYAIEIAKIIQKERQQ